MMARFTSAALVAVATVLLVTLTGCSDSPQPRESTDVDFTSATQAGEPIRVDIEVGGTIVITPPTPAYLQERYWSASIDNPMIVRFSPADGSGRAASMPLFTGTQVGETIAVLTYTGGATPQTATFDITVASP